jgi:hypothetical protein
MSRIYNNWSDTIVSGFDAIERSPFHAADTLKGIQAEVDSLAASVRLGRWPLESWTDKKIARAVSTARGYNPRSPIVNLGGVGCLRVLPISGDLISVTHNEELHLVTVWHLKHEPDLNEDMFRRKNARFGAFAEGDYIYPPQMEQLRDEEADAAHRLDRAIKQVEGLRKRCTKAERLVAEQAVELAREELAHAVRVVKSYGPHTKKGWDVTNSMWAQWEPAELERAATLGMAYEHALEVLQDAKQMGCGSTEYDGAEAYAEDRDDF